MKTTTSLNLKILKWHNEVPIIQKQSRLDNGEHKIEKYEIFFNEMLNI